MPGLPASLGEQAALPDPGFTDHEDRASGSRCEVVDCVGNRAQLIHTTHERNVRVGSPICWTESDRSLDDLALPFELEQSRRAPRHGVAELTPRFGTDKHRSDVGMGLQPGCDVHGIAGRARLLVAPASDGADHHEPGLDAHPDTEIVDARGPRYGLGMPLDDPLDFQAGEHRAFRVVLVRVRRAEEREDAVAGEVLHHAAEALDDLAELPDGTTDDLNDVFRVETGRQFGGSRHVGEQSRHGSASAGTRSILRHPTSVVPRAKGRTQ